MREIILTLSDIAYEQLIANATAVHKSPEQWIVDKLLVEQSTQIAIIEPQVLLTAALDALGFQRLELEKAHRLSELLQVRKQRELSEDEIVELNGLLAEADALEVESLRRLAATLDKPQDTHP